MVLLTRLHIGQPLQKKQGYYRWENVRSIEDGMVVIYNGNAGGIEHAEFVRRRLF